MRVLPLCHDLAICSLCQIVLSFDQFQIRPLTLWLVMSQSPKLLKLFMSNAQRLTLELWWNNDIKPISLHQLNQQPWIEDGEMKKLRYAFKWRSLFRLIRDLCWPKCIILGIINVNRIELALKIAELWRHQPHALPDSPKNCGIAVMSSMHQTMLLWCNLHLFTFSGEPNLILII